MDEEEDWGKRLLIASSVFFFLLAKTEKLSKNRKNRVEFHVLLHFYVTIFGKMEKLRAFGQLRLQKKHCIRYLEVYAQTFF